MEPAAFRTMLDRLKMPPELAALNIPAHAAPRLRSIWSAGPIYRHEPPSQATSALRTRSGTAGLRQSSLKIAALNAALTSGCTFRAFHSAGADDG